MNKAEQMKQIAVKAQENSERLKKEEAQRIIKDIESKILAHARNGDMQIGIKFEEMMGLHERISPYFQENGYHLTHKNEGIIISWECQEEKRHWRVLTTFEGRDFYSQVGFDDLAKEYKEFKNLPRGVVSTVMNELEGMFNGRNEFTITSSSEFIIVIREFLRKAGYKVEDEDVSYDYVNISKRLTVKK